jgi:hypothetical protein
MTQEPLREGEPHPGLDSGVEAPRGRLRAMHPKQGDFNHGGTTTRGPAPLGVSMVIPERKLNTPLLSAKCS